MTAGRSSAAGNGSLTGRLPPLDSNDMGEQARRGPILLTGATGYVGGRLLQPLLDAEYEVRCLARRPEVLAARVRRSIEVIAGDCLVPASLDRALSDVRVAFYLVHSLGSTADFEEQERAAARSLSDIRSAAPGRS